MASTYKDLSDFQPSDIVECSSVVNEFVAGETISALKVVYLDALTNRIFKADSSNLITSSAVGITKSAGLEGSSVKVLQYGPMSDASFSFSPPDLVMLGNEGSISTEAPESGFLTRIGRVINNNTILVLIESPITL